MRRFLTLVCLLGVAIPAGFTISGCTRNPAAKYCTTTSGYGRKITDVASITIGPQTTGVSLAFGQTTQISSPQAKTCLGTNASVTSFSYGTTNNQYVDISPTGSICAGTWNRNSGGAIPNYTICNFPNPLPTTGGLPYGQAYITASADSVTSNPVEVFVHPQVTSISLVTTPTSGGPQTCTSQTQTAQLDAQACFVDPKANQQQILCAPSTASAPYACSPPQLPQGATIPTCSSVLGTLSFGLGNSSLASINQDTNVITAELPGTTVVTASVAGGSSQAGFFSVCPPASINVTLANGSTAGTITQGVQQNLTTTITDTNGNSITGLSLDYQSTDPVDISATSGGDISTTFPGIASIYAICQPSTCNPSPINQIGLYGTGLPISSNPVSITTPGTASDLVWFGSPGQSQYFEPVELLTGTVGGTVLLPYVPNSMVMDKGGNSLYFGSAHELMVYAAFSNTLTRQDPNAPGVVLAVSPDNSLLLINDQARRLFTIYLAAGGSNSTFGGMGNAAEWTPDAKTLYITDNANLNTPASCPAPLITGHSDTLYVYNVNTGWTTYPLPPSPLPPGAQPTCNTPPNVAGNVPANGLPINLGSYPPIQTPAITIPSVGAYLRGLPTTSHTWCPTGTVGGALQFYPQADSIPAQSDVLAATTDGTHILGASLPLNTSQISLADIGVSVPTGANAQCPGAGSNNLSALSTGGTPIGTVPFNNQHVVATSVNQVVASPASNLAFITYSGSTSGALLPYYQPVPYTPAPPGTGKAPVVGTVGYVTLTDCQPTLASGAPNPAWPCNSTVTAPLAGAFTPDDQFFFVSTAGDNMIHYISVPTLTDTQQIAPNLPACTPISEGGVDAGCTYTGTTAIVPSTVIVVKPRPTT